MNTATFISSPSSGMAELKALFESLQMPYRRGDIVRFNLAYQRLYTTLSPHEKLKAETLVDALLENREDEPLAPGVIDPF